MLFFEILKNALPNSVYNIMSFFKNNIYKLWKSRKAKKNMLTIIGYLKGNKIVVIFSFCMTIF